MKAFFLRVKDGMSHHSRWIMPINTMLMTAFAGFLTYSPPDTFVKTHPIQADLAKHFLLILPILFGITLVIFLIFSLFAILDTDTIRGLKSELLDEKEKNLIIGDNIRNFVDGYLYQIAGNLGFGQGDRNTERISLYIHDSVNKFIPFGRYSGNPNFRKKTRTEYPDGQGCISRGWQDGWHFDNDFSARAPERAKKHGQMGIPKEVYTNFSMPSCVYAVKRVSDRDGNNIAVMVVEATDSRRFVEEDIKKALEAQTGFISELITKLKKHIPMPETARQKGL